MTTYDAPPPGSAAAYAASHRILCAHADSARHSAHWLEPGERCPDAQRPPVTPPLETERQARELPAVRATYDAMHASTRRGVMAQRNHRMLCEALTAAGVEPGAFERRMLLWLSNWEPETCAVFAALITRAASGTAAGR
ncbi:MAG TPA: hypothetical protein VMV92_20400 [Streptosporangiaceae bacterium]|nr:hypothetical protein [Streptosporangiaceae bacterium]